MKAQADSTIASTKLKSSIVSKIKAVLSKLNDRQKRDIVGSPKEVIASAEGCVSKLEVFRGELDTLAPSGIDDAVTKMACLQSTLTEQVSKAEEFFGGLKFLQTEAAAEQRKGKLHLNYVRGKLATSLASNGFGANFARAMSDRIRNLVENPGNEAVQMHSALEGMDVSQVTVWDDTTDIGKHTIAVSEDSWLQPSPRVQMVERWFGRGSLIGASPRTHPARRRFHSHAIIGSTIPSYLHIPDGA